MRRPALHHSTDTVLRTVGGWAHPYTPTPYGPLYADGDPATPPATPPAGNTAPNGEPPKPGPPPAAKEFTQDDLERVGAREKAQGKRSAAKEFAEKHGFSSIEDAETFIAAARQAQQDQMTEQQRREQELAERERKATEREAAAVARERIASRRAALVGLGATGDDLEDAAALLRVEDDADDATVQTAAEALKERRPELFGAAAPAAPATSPGPPPAPGGSPAGGPPPRTPATKDDIKSRAVERARKMGFAKKADAA